MEVGDWLSLVVTLNVGGGELLCESPMRLALKLKRYGLKALQKDMGRKEWNPLPIKLKYGLKDLQKDIGKKGMESPSPILIRVVCILGNGTIILHTFRRIDLI